MATKLGISGKYINILNLLQNENSDSQLLDISDITVYLAYTDVYEIPDITSSSELDNATFLTDGQTSGTPGKVTNCNIARAVSSHRILPQSEPSRKSNHSDRTRIEPNQATVGYKCGVNI